MRSSWRAVAPTAGILALTIACRNDAREAAGLLGGVNIYSATGPNALAPDAARARPLVYVPNSRSRSVSVIDPAKYAVVWTIPTGKIPQHVVPSWDLRTLWILNNAGNSVKPIDPITGTAGPVIRVDDPYNMYFTPDGRSAIVVAEALSRLDFRDPHTMALQQSIPVECRGLDHMEFTADGKWAIATCEFSGELVKLDVDARRIVGYLKLEDGDKPSHESMPQDIRSSPNGRVFYVADMTADGVWAIDPIAFRRIGFTATGRGTHGLIPSRDGRRLYVTNRGWHTVLGGLRGPGSVTVLDPGNGGVVANWPIPGGGSPDMGDVTSDGRELWVSGRYDREVYVIDTRTGQLTHRIPVGVEPHGLCVWPQPGRYSLGHTGNMR